MTEKYKNSCGCIFTYNWKTKIITSIVACKMPHLKIIYDMRRAIEGGNCNEVERAILGALDAKKTQRVLVS